MVTLKDLGASYAYVQTEDAISAVTSLLKLDRALSGTGPTSVYIGREETGGANLLRLKGLGKHLWKGIDAQKYIDELRNEWEV
jgi:hypothetical protein